MIKRCAASILTVFFVMSIVFPAMALGRGNRGYRTPDGYNEHDYQKMLAFMETEDPSGVKNGEKIAACFSGYYDPADPLTWSYYYYDHENAILYLYGVFWSEEPDYRVAGLVLSEMGLVGGLDVSGCSELSSVSCDGNRFPYVNFAGCSSLYSVSCRNCTIQELDLSGCTGLEMIDCSGNLMEELDVSECSSAYDVECQDSMIETLDVSGCPGLVWLNCSGNDLTELDLSSNTSLEFLNCTGNGLTELDLTNNPLMSFDMITAEGGGHVGYTNYGYIDDEGFWVNPDRAVAEPNGQNAFLGWYSEDGTFIASGTELEAGSTSYTRVKARFGAGVMGDADGNGTVDIPDALMVLRAAMGLIPVTAQMQSLCDVDGTPGIGIPDALKILRYAMGLISSL